MMKVSFNMRMLHFRIGILCIILLTNTAISFGGTAQKKIPQKKSPTLVLESADSNENTYENDEFISVLKGNVIFTYDDIRIRSDEATWLRNQGVVTFQNNVRVFRGKQTITCDRLHFTKTNNLLTANGRFHFTDSLEKTQITGKDAEYRIDTKYFQLTGDPRMMRCDTATAETLFISGLKMWYIDSLKQATVSDSVRITKGKLFSKCRVAYYFTQANKAQLRSNPEVVYEINHITGDSINLTFGKESLKNAMVMGRTHGIYTDTSGVKKDTAFTHIWGDSLLMTISDSGRLDSLWVFGKAKSKYYETISPDVINEASGKRMLMSFMKDGTVRNVKIWGNARSRYFIEEQKTKGINEASGDSITVAFRKGKASQLTLAGSARGVYFPRDL